MVRTSILTSKQKEKFSKLSKKTQLLRMKRVKKLENDFIKTSRKIDKQFITGRITTTRAQKLINKKFMGIRKNSAILLMSR